MASSASGPLTCSKDFSPASLPTVLMSSNTALLACCWKTRRLVRKLAAVNKNLGLFWGGMTHWVLAELFVGSSDPSLFSPADKHLGVRHHYSYEVGLARPNTKRDQMRPICQRGLEPDRTWRRVVTRCAYL